MFPLFSQLMLPAFSRLLLLRLHAAATRESS
jgi:hypothetical protein